MPDTNDNNSSISSNSSSSSNILLSHSHALEQTGRATSEWQLQKIKSEILPCRRLRLLNSFPAGVAAAAFSGSLAAVAAQSTFGDFAVDCAQCSAENTLHTVKTTTQSEPRPGQAGAAPSSLCMRVCVCVCSFCCRCPVVLCVSLSVSGVYATRADDRATYVLRVH